MPKLRWMSLPGLLYAQVVKQYRRKRVIGVTHRLVFGTLEAVKHVLTASEQPQQRRLPVTSHPSCPCPVVRAGGRQGGPAARLTRRGGGGGLPGARGETRSPRASAPAGGRLGGTGWADAGGGKGSVEKAV